MKPGIEYYRGALSPQAMKTKQNIDTAVNTVKGIPRAAGQLAQMAGRKVLGQFKKGGKVKKTGKYMVHKGEKVVKKKAKMTFDKMHKKMYGV